MKNNAARFSKWALRLLAALVSTLLLFSCAQESDDDDNDDPKPVVTPGKYSELDWDADGLSNEAEINEFHTNPYDSDTDGDGYSDYEEAIQLKNGNSNKFNPVLADTPDISIVLTSTPSITLAYTDTEGVSESKAVTDSESVSRTTSSSNTKGRTSSWEGGFTVGVKFTEKVDTLGKGEFSAEESASTSFKWVHGDSTTFSESNARTIADSYATSKSESVTKSKTYTGGTISVKAKIRNTSNISYVVDNIMLEAYKITYGSNGQTSSAITNLYPSSVNAADPTQLNATISADSETGDITFSSAVLSMAVMENLMNGLVGLHVNVSTIKISSEDTRDFTKITTAVDAKTALFTIDYGPCFDSTVMPIAKKLPESKSFLVATKRIPVISENGSPVSFKDISLTQILEDCAPNVVEYYEDEDGHKMIKKINGVEGKFTNPDAMEGDWFVSVVTYENGLAKVKYYSPSSEEYYYNADEVFIRVGDDVTVMYSVDKDEDGIPLREEELFGTSDNAVDSDGDTISDWDELSGWVVLQTGVTTCTNPALKDTDADGIPDNEDAYPTISSIFSNAYLDKMNISYTPFTQYSFDKGKSMNLVVEFSEEEYLKKAECEILTLDSIDPAALNSNGSTQYAYTFAGGRIPSSSFTLEPVLKFGNATYEYYLIYGWAEKDASYDNVKGLKIWGNEKYAGLTAEEYENKIDISSAADDGVLTLDPLPIGKFKIAVKVNSADGEKHVWYVIRFDSPLEVPSYPKAGLTASDTANAKVALSWAKINDTRATNVLIVRCLEEEARKTLVPEHNFIVSAENAVLQTDTTSSPYYMIVPADSVSTMDEIGWNSTGWYYLFTYYKDVNTNEYYVSDLGVPVSSSSELPDTFSVSAKFNMLTITDDHGDSGHEFEIKWTIWQQLEVNGREELVCDHNQLWEGDYENVYSSNWYSMENEEATAMFTNLRKDQDHYMKIHIRIVEEDDGGSDDDIDNVNIELVYTASDQSLKYQKVYHNSGADSKSELTPTEFSFGHETPVRFKFDTSNACKSVDGYFDMTLLWAK